MKDEERKSVPAIPENKSYHPLTCYTSKKFDYSVKLNEILNQEELSFKFTINEKDDYKVTILSESLGLGLGLELVLGIYNGLFNELNNYGDK
ncbi:unnamed protein product [Rhizophagus irregularis]|nr:unnamed protein product [Rhizophagus irregularis]